MNWVFTVAIVIILIIIGFFMFIFMPKPTVFYSPYTDTITAFAPNHDKIVQEVENYDSKNPVIPIYGFGEIKSVDFPFIYELLRSVPYVRFAGIINLKPKFQQAREYGLDRVANHTVRYFYTIKEPAGQKSGIWIDGAKKFFSDREWICGDMSREHSLFNKDKDRYATVLFIDIDRHEDIHEGRSPNSDIKKDEVLKMFVDNVYQKDNNVELHESQDAPDAPE
jgi:hypothetical protein